MGRQAPVAGTARSRGLTVNVGQLRYEMAYGTRQDQSLPPASRNSPLLRRAENPSETGSQHKADTGTGLLVFRLPSGSVLLNPKAAKQRHTAQGTMTVILVPQKVGFHRNHLWRADGNGLNVSAHTTGGRALRDRNPHTAQSTRSHPFCNLFESPNSRCSMKVTPRSLNPKIPANASKVRTVMAVALPVAHALRASARV